MVRYEYWISKDEERVKGPFPEYNDAWMQMHHVQGQSVYYATKWGGWSIDPVRKQGAGMEHQIKATVEKVEAKTKGWEQAGRRETSHAGSRQKWKLKSWTSDPNANAAVWG